MGAQTSPELRYDVVVIGSGPAGQRAAMELARGGRKVAVVERRVDVGGLCLHEGTIPSKALRAAILVLTGWRYRNLEFTDPIRSQSRFDVETLLRHVDTVIENELAALTRKLNRQGIDLHFGEARFAGRNAVEVVGENGTTVLTAAHIVVAAGTRAFRPPGIPFDGTTIIDTDQVFCCLEKLRGRLIIVGGGVIAMEYASMFSILGVEVHLLNRRDRVLPFVDRDVVKVHTDHLEARGVTLHLGSEVESAETKNGRPSVRLRSGRALDADLVMFATGRQGNGPLLALDRAGIQPTSNGLIEVNEHYQSGVPHIYAVGDIIGYPSLASTSREQGRLAACHLLDPASEPEPVTLFPFGVYTVPELAWVGPTEDELMDRGETFVAGVGYFSDVAKAGMLAEETGMLKILVQTGSRRLLAVHACGMEVTELVHIGHSIISLGGTLEHLLDNVFNYPTLAESYKLAAYDAQSRMDNK
jgi:NAD(P) transhydrogenase